MTLLARFFDYQGRIARSTWLGRTIALAVVAIAFGFLAGALAGDAGRALVAAIFVSGAAALATRRLHDAGRTAWSLAVVVVPVVGPLWLLFQLTRPGVEGRNRYGSDPLARFDYLTVDIAR